MVARKVTLQLDETTDRQLRRLARECGRSEDDVIREAVERLLREQSRPEPAKAGETAYALAARLGLIGRVTDAPPDLSSDDRHMQGFGG